MQVTHNAIRRGLAKLADTPMSKTAARRRWLEDTDLVKLCQLFKAQQSRKK
jgi:hypothetical protein